MIFDNDIQYAAPSVRGREIVEMWSSLSERASKGLTDALEKGSQAFNQAEKQASKRFAEALEKTKPTEVPTQSTSMLQEDTHSGKGDLVLSRLKVPGVDQEKVLKNLQMGWTSITKRTVEATKDIKDLVDTERARLEENFALRKKGFYKRDPSLPLDREALSDAEVVRNGTQNKNGVAVSFEVLTVFLSVESLSFCV